MPVTCNRSLNCFKRNFDFKLLFDMIKEFITFTFTAKLLEHLIDT